MKFRPPGDCPVCGESVPARAASCPGCGACARSGWNDEEDDEAEFDYGRFVEEEFGSGPKQTGKQTFWRWVALAVLLAFGLIVLWPYL